MCRKLIILIFFVMVLGLAAVSVADMVAYWPLDEGTGGITPDESGNGLDGTLIGGPSFAAGMYGPAIQLDGSNTQYVNCGTDPAFDITEQITVAAWIKMDHVTDRQPIVNKEGDGVRGVGYRVEEGGIVHVQLYKTGGGVKTDLNSTVSLEADRWYHLAFTYEFVGDGSSITRLYIDGEEHISTDATVGPLATNTQIQEIGRYVWSGSYQKFFSGLVDDVVIFNHTLSADEIQGIMNGVGGGFPLASSPDPRDGAIHEDTWVTLSWRPGDSAVSHDVYFGDNFDDVNNGTGDTFQGNQVSTLLIVGFSGFAFPDGLFPGTTYYWRIDEINDQDPNSPWKGDVWSFWIPPKKAYEPNPADGSKFVDTDAELSWTAGFGTKLHYVYFGDNFDDVNNATVGIPSAFNAYTPGTLELGKTYYWGIDEFDGVATNKGDVWSFSTIPIVAITNPNLIGWWKFDEGPGGTAVDWSGHDNHGSLTGTALSWMPDDGMIGGALSFNGTASDTDYVEISTADISLTAGTVAMWAKIRPNPQAPDTRYFFGHTTIPAWNDRIQLYMDNSDTVLDLGLGDSHATLTDIMNLATETWYHVALTWDGGNYVVYVNGEEKANGSYTDLETLNTIADIGNDGNPGDRTEAFNGLLDNVRIYNYALSQAEIPLAMRGDLLAAWAPNPAPGSTPYIREVTPLSWSQGDNASGHDVYFGIDRDAVVDADASDTTGIYQGRQGVTFYTPAEGVEWGGGPYYWRIDEYNTDATISKGNVWSFTVIDFIEIDDFEDYNDYPPDEIFSTWIDGWEVPTNGSLAGHADPPFAETTIVHGGSQSMPVYYENNFKYSEITMTLVYPRDWTEEGVGVLSLWFYGDASNAAERMYVALNGSAVVYHDEPSAALIEEWTEWTINLSAPGGFAAQGVNLANVNTISIGFGDKNNLQAGGSGLVFFDDIRLYRSAPLEPEPEP